MLLLSKFIHPSAYLISLVSYFLEVGHLGLNRCVLGLQSSVLLLQGLHGVHDLLHLILHGVHLYHGGVGGGLGCGCSLRCSVVICVAVGTHHSVSRLFYWWGGEVFLRPHGGRQCSGLKIL